MGSLLDPVQSAASDDAYLLQLTDRAHRERLSEHLEWQALLHYKPQRLSRGVQSLVDSDSFFLSPVGRSDPEAELDATLAAFFATNGTDPDKSAQCMYVARYRWLKEKLAIDPARLPELTCRRFNRWFEELNHGRLTLVFPAAYLNNPASMFGHTLLRIDPHDQDERTRLLATTVNYAADTGQQRGVGFAFKGLFGMYHGRFSLAPYYLKVKAYGDIENRDIWEYELNLTEAETGRLLRHLWEMRSAWFDYYFLDENCSYHLLSLLETARPGLRLTDRFSWWTIPSEMVRAVTETDMVQKVHFRPARNTVLQERARLMDSGSQILAKRLTEGEVTADSDAMLRLTPLEQARVIELALDFAAYRKSPRFGGTEQNAGTVAELLMARSRLDVPDQTPVITSPEIPPGQGHKPARAGIGYGYEDRRHYVEVTAGPGYHDIFDPDGGFTPGAGVSALNAAVRFYPDEGKVELERIDVLDIMSLSSWGRFLRPVSWKVDLGILRKRVDSAERPLMGRLNGGIGISHDFSRQTSAHAFAEATLELNDRFSYFAAPGVGPGIGVLHDFSDRWRSGLFFVWQHFFLDEWRNDLAAVLKNRITMYRQGVLGLDLSWKREFGNSFGGLHLYWQFYF